MKNTPELFSSAKKGAAMIRYSPIFIMMQIALSGCYSGAIAIEDSIFGLNSDEQMSPVLHMMTNSLLADRNMVAFEDWNTGQLFTTILNQGELEFHISSLDHDTVSCKDKMLRAKKNMTRFADTLLENAKSSRTYVLKKTTTNGRIVLTRIPSMGYSINPFAQYYITRTSILDALKELCPLWPICN